MRFILSITVFIFASFNGLQSYAQGINFQGVARSSNGTIISSSNISLRLSIISKNVDATPEYVETKTVVTNPQGIFSVVVGDAANATVVGNFKNIAWSEGIKFLKVEMDPAAGSNFINMGATQLQYVPYAFYSLGVDANNISGTLSVEKGGTGVTSLNALKTALNLTSGNIDTMSLSNRIDTKASIISPVFSGAITASSFKIPNGTSAQYLKADGTVSTSVTAGVPYTGASQAVDLGAFDMKVNGITVGAGSVNASATENLVVGNTAIGFESLKSNTTGYRNSAIGYQSLSNNISGLFNTAIGFESLTLNTTGDRNTAIGANALYSNTTGRFNTAVGRWSLGSNTTGDSSLAIGYSALYFNTTGSKNVAVGRYSLQSNVGNSGSTAIGYDAMRNADNRTMGRITGNTAIGFESLRGSTSPVNNTGINNSSFGHQALFSNSSGASNTAIGVSALLSNTTASFNTAIGVTSLYNNTSGWSNTGLGVNSLFSNTTGSYNTALGSSALYFNTTSSNNVAVGYQAMNNNTTGSLNIAIGTNSLYANVMNSGSIAIGYEAMRNANSTESQIQENTRNIAIGFQALRGGPDAALNTGMANTVIGYQALINNTSGSANTSIGQANLINNNSGNDNVAIGQGVMGSNTSGSFNISIGSSSLSNNTIGLQNIAIGNSALSSNKSKRGSVAIGYMSMIFADNNPNNSIWTGNTAIGWSSMRGSDIAANNTGIWNTAIGAESLNSISTGNANTAVGNSSLRNNTTGIGNTAIGNFSMQTNTTGQYNTVIGNAANVSSNNLSNSTAIGNSALVTTSNTIQLGDNMITDVKTSGTITASGYKIPSGTSTQTLMADGSVNSNTLILLNKILYVNFINSSRPEIWIANYDGTSATKVNIVLPTGIEFEDGLENTKMSPDGKKIFFNAGPADSPGVYYSTSTDIYSCNIDGTNVVKIIDRSTSNSVRIRSAN